MKIERLTPHQRRKNVATKTATDRPFLRWNTKKVCYEFVVSFSQTPSGEVYQVIGTQIEWEAVFESLQRTFLEASA